jgi:hypothetical protein
MSATVYKSNENQASGLTKLPKKQGDLTSPSENTREK